MTTQDLRDRYYALKEDIRHEYSRLLIDTDKEHSLETWFPIDEEAAMGLSSLELTHIEKIYQIPGEGIIVFVDEFGNEIDFDDMSLYDLIGGLDTVE